MSRKTSVLMLIVLTLAFSLIPSIYAKSPIENVEVFQDFPEVMIAGNTYQMIITFDNIASEEITPIVVITITSEEPIGYGEIFIDKINLNGFDLDYIELPSGTFTTVEGSVAFNSQDNELSIIVYTAINLMPGAYTFEVDLLGEEVFDFVVEVPANTPTTIDAKEEVGVVLEGFTSTEPATVTINSYDYNPHPEAEDPPDSPMSLGIFLDFMTTAIDFTTEIRVYYMDEVVDVAEIDEGDLRLYYFDVGWVPCVPSGVNTQENYVWAEVTHFTVFAPFGTEAEEEEPSHPPSIRPNKNPVAVAGLDQTVYVNQTVVFNGTESYDRDGTITEWRWKFEDGTKLFGEIVNRTFSDPGNYTVTLTVKDNKNAVGSDTCIITVRETPPLPPPPPPPPLPPMLSDLFIAPEEIELGEDVTIGLNIKNMDNQSLTYIITMQIGELTVQVDVELEPYEFKTVTHTITPDVAGAWNVKIDGMAGSFTVVYTPEPPAPKPAEFVWANFTYTEEIYEGEPFELSIDVINIGETAGDAVAIVKMNGEEVHVMGVHLESGRGSSKTWISFHPYTVGTYTLELDGFEGGFVVLEIPKESIPFWRHPMFVIWATAATTCVAIAVGLYLRWRATIPKWPVEEN